MGVARPRLHYLDWLRTIAVFGVFVYHAAQPFSTDDWRVKNAELSEAVDVPIAFFGSWGSGSSSSWPERGRSSRSAGEHRASSSESA
jgi:hypothetical protein